MNKNMKILILLKKWSGGVGGGIKNISKEFKTLGYEVKIISREEDLKCFSFIKSFKITRKVLDKVAKDYDIIYTQDWSLAFPLIFPSVKYRSKHYCVFHGNQVGSGRIFQNIVGMIMGKKLLVMAPSLKKRFKNSTINYCGVSDKQFKPLRKKRKYIGWIDKDSECIRINSVKEIAKRLGLPFIVAKEIPYEKMNSFYNKCLVFISLPPASAGFQAAWLEAMMAGVPKVIGNINGSGELQPFDKVPLGKENDTVLITNIIRQAKRKDYINWVKENEFSWKRHVKKLIEIFSVSKVKK